MKSRLAGKGKVPGAPKASPAVPKIKAATAVPAAGAAWRDRLNKKITAQTGNQSSTRTSNKNTTPRNPFLNTAPGNSSRKTRKGLRPG